MEYLIQLRRSVVILVKLKLAISTENCQFSFLPLPLLKIATFRCHFSTPYPVWNAPVYASSSHTLPTSLVLPLSFEPTEGCTWFISGQKENSHHILLFFHLYRFVVIFFTCNFDIKKRIYRHLLSTWNVNKSVTT